MLTGAQFNPIEDEQSWRTAKNYAFILEPVPSRLSQAITILEKNHLENLLTGQNLVSAESLKSIGLIDKTASLKIPLYFAASKLYPEKFKAAEDDTIKAIISVLEPGLFAALVATIFLFRRVNKLATNHPSWETLSKAFLANTEIGFILGSAIPQVGAADGVLIGGIRFAALASFMLRSSEHYEKIKKNKHKPDVQNEMQTFKCNHCQISAIILQSLGFSGSTFDYSKALNFTNTELLTDKRLNSWRTAINIIDSIKEKSYQLKDSSLKRSFRDNTASHLENLQTQILHVLKNGSSFTWITRNSHDDLNEEKLKEEQTPKS